MRAQRTVQSVPAGDLQLHPSTPRIAVVIPCYRVCDHIGKVIAAIGPEVAMIFCVDDACPDGSGDHIRQEFAGDDRVEVITKTENSGVGGATCTGYRAALEAGADIVVKLDGDGQMNPALIGQFVAPILSGEADYVKGNRFFSIETLSEMSTLRIVGNGGLSFMTKMSTGYWDLFDPTNGYTAIAANVLAALPLRKLHPRFFFESDMLFRLSTIRARVIELPLQSLYGDEQSNLSILNALVTFPLLHLRNLLKRLFYSYFLRGFSIASLNLLLGLLLLTFGTVFGATEWIENSRAGTVATPGTVMLAALPILLGLQMLLSFLSYDVAMTPSQAIHDRMRRVMVLRQRDDGEGGDA